MGARPARAERGLPDIQRRTGCGSVSSSRSVSWAIRSTSGSSANPVMPETYSRQALGGECRWGHLAWRPCLPGRPRTTDDAALPRHSADRLIVRGAREHNLKDVSLDLPRDALIVFTGLSGSGKSSLAFDTIFAEGQRRYVESLSAYARQFLGQMDKPDVDFIEGLSPGRLDRPEVDQPQPALDRRHDHRGLRLPAPAVRPGRPAALPGLRRADHPADPAADRRPAARAARGHPVPGAGAGRPRPQGRVRRPVPRAADQGLRPGPGRRRGRRADRAARRSTRSSSTRIDVVVDRLVVKAGAPSGG